MWCKTICCRCLSNIAMEPPPTLSIESLRDERVKVLKSVQPLTAEDIVRGQYTGYLDTPGVKPGSTTETYVALRLTINSWRWRGVPFFVRAGKSLPKTETEVIAKLRPAVSDLFGLHAPPANYVRFRISGDPVIAIGASIKTAGDQLRGCGIELVADQECGEDVMLPYEELLGDAMAGNQTWFAREDYVEEAWRIVDPILDGSSVCSTSQAAGALRKQTNSLRRLEPGGIRNKRLTIRRRDKATRSGFLGRKPRKGPFLRSASIVKPYALRRAHPAGGRASLRDGKAGC